VQATDTPVTLDIQQLRDVTLDDAGLMRDILAALAEDTAQQIHLLESAIHARDAERCMRLAHYSKGACANVGAISAAALLRQIETRAAARQFQECSEALAALALQVGLLREEAKTLSD
jgi:HPt (histidine-containing phosphotransfer) domain-containing protein